MEKNNVVQNIINFLLKYGLIIVSIIIAILGICSIFITAYFETSYDSASEFTIFRFSFGIIEIVLSLLLVSVIFLICNIILKKIKNIFLLIPLSILILVAFVIWISVLKLQPITDQIKIHEMARDLINGGIAFHFSFAQYLFLYPYQFGLVYFVSLIYSIFGINFMVIQYLNAVCSVINFYLLYRISNKIFKDEKIQKILIFLLACFSLYWMFFNVHLYGNIIGLTFALIAVSCTMNYLENKKLVNVLIAGIFISISIIIKTNYNIFLCGLVLILVLDIIKYWKPIKLWAFPVMLIGYLIITCSYNLIAEKVYNIDFPDGVPMVNFIYMGMSENDMYLCSGWYNNETLNIFHGNGCDAEKSSKESIDLIGKRLNYFWNNPNKFFEYYGKKIGSTWLNPTFQTIWCSTPGYRYELDKDYASYITCHKVILDMVVSYGGLYKIEEKLLNAYQIIIFIFSSLGIFVIAKNKNLKPSMCLLPIIFIGGFVFHILWETKAIYVIQYYYLLLPFTAYGLNYIFEKINDKISKNKELNN